jgi:hypothetical protein
MMSRAALVLIALALGACGVQPLRSEELYPGPVNGGPGADAAIADATPADAALADMATPDTMTAPDAMMIPDTAVDPSCGQGDTGSVSGYISDACNGYPIDDAQVGIAGKHGCSWTGKGSFDLPGLPVGCERTLVIMRAGYKIWSMPILLKPTGNAGIAVRLEREGGCTTMPPATSACTCIDGTCPKI